MNMSDPLRCDLLVLGAGMAGLSAAAWAAQRGARVVVIEKAKDIGGSALSSAGLVWTVPSTRQLRYVDDGDWALGAVVIETFAEAIAWLRSRSIPMSGPLAVLYGRGYQIDMARYLQSCVAAVEQAGGQVQTATVTERLLSDASGRVVGARIVQGAQTTSVFATDISLMKLGI